MECGKQGNETPEESSEEKVAADKLKGKVEGIIYSLEPCPDGKIHGWLYGKDWHLEF